MALQSELFRGDPKLEGAAVSDPAHIAPGANGTHVAKIQLALNLLDSAAIVQDGKYGHSTAAAVLAYKRKRNIVNRSYETKADDIVGKMTMASLDEEMLNWERLSRTPPQIVPISEWRIRSSRPPILAAFLSQPVGFNVPSSATPVGGLHIEPGKVLLLRPIGSGLIKVLDGNGADIVIQDPDIAVLLPTLPVFPVPQFPGAQFTIASDFAMFQVISQNKLGDTSVRVRKPNGDFASLDVAVIPFGFPLFHDGDAHDHDPSGKWSEVQRNPNSGMFDVAGINIDCNATCGGNSDPNGVVSSIQTAFRLFPVASAHIDHYLKGSGADFDENDNILDWILNDAGIREALRIAIFPLFPSRAVQNPKGEFQFGQNKYKNSEFKLAFGTIDFVDFEVNFGDDTVHIWFKDRYEWHPVYPGLYHKKHGDEVRATNCIHAAMVEMKRPPPSGTGARDYWMKGEAVVPLATILRP